MKHAKTSFSREIFAGAIISVVQYLAPLRYHKTVTRTWGSDFHAFQLDLNSEQHLEKRAAPCASELMTVNTHTQHAKGTRAILPFKGTAIQHRDATRCSGHHVEIESMLCNTTKKALAQV
jgi:hypothetical protein